MLIDTDTATIRELAEIIKGRTAGFVLAYTGTDEDGTFFELHVKEGHLMASMGLVETLRDKMKELIKQTRDLEKHGPDEPT